MKLAEKIRVLIIERQADMMIRLLSFFEKRPDIEVVDANKNVQTFIDEANFGLGLRALMDVLRPDAVIVDLREPLDEDLIWISRIQEIAYAPLIAFSSCALPGRSLHGVHFFEVIPRPLPGDDAAALRSMRLLAFALRRTRAGHAELGLPPRRPGISAARCSAGLIAIGASAGGTEAILQIVSALPPDMPPLLIVQHITRGFAEVFATHLNRRSALCVKVAEEGEAACPGYAYIAPDDRHLTVERHGNAYILRCRAGEKQSGHMPSINTLFHSVAEAAGANAVGVILTGMGRDGADGLRHMREAGAFTLGQDEASSLIYGLPRAACELDAVCRQLPLSAMAAELMKHSLKEVRT